MLHILNQTLKKHLTYRARNSLALVGITLIVLFITAITHEIPEIMLVGFVPPLLLRFAVSEELFYRIPPPFITLMVLLMGLTLWVLFIVASLLTTGTP